MNHVTIHLVESEALKSIRRNIYIWNGLNSIQIHLDNNKSFLIR